MKLCTRIQRHKVMRNKRLFYSNLIVYITCYEAYIYNLHLTSWAIQNAWKTTVQITKHNLGHYKNAWYTTMYNTHTMEYSYTFSTVYILQILL